MGQQTPGREPADAGADRPKPLSAEELRCQAEERLGALSAATPATEDATVHELRVHQIELEMQNEEMRRAQLEIEGQRAKYFELFDLAPVGQLVLTDEGLVRDANLTAARALNVERRQLVGKPFTAFICASDQDAYYLYRRLLEKTKTPQTCELRLQPVGAEPVWAHVESRPQGAADGEPSRCYVSLIDVPERVLAEERLRLSREHYRALVENVNVVTFTLDRQGAFAFVSPAIEQLLGYTSAEVEGVPFSRFVHPDDRGGLAESLAEALGGVTAAHELRVLDRAGAVHWVVTRNSLSTADGSPPSITGVMSDISERKQTEAALQESEKRFRALVEWTPEAIVVHRDGKLIYVNPAAVRMFGATAAQDLVGKAILELIHPAFHQIVLDRVEKGLEDDLGAPLTEIRYLKLDGTTIDAEVQGTPIIYDGEPAIRVALRDVTARKRAEEALRATAALLSGLLASIPDLVFFKDMQGVYLGCNAEFARYVGRDEAAIVGASDQELFSKEIADAYREQDQIMMAQGGPRHNEEWIEYPDGVRRFVDTFKAPLSDVDGRVIGVLGVSRDITQRQRAEDALRRSERSLQSTLDGLASSVVVLDERGTIVLVNKSWRAFAEQNGLAGGSVCEGANYLQVCDAAVGTDAAEAAPFAAGIRAVLSGETDSYLVEYPCDAPGEKRWFSGRVTVFPSDGAPHVVVAHEDITERKQVEEELRDATARLALATRAGGVGLWDYVVADDTLTWDDQMLSLYGITREQFSGAYEAWQACLHPDDRERGDAEIQMALRGEQEVDTEFRVCWPDGTIRDIHALALVQRDASGRATHMIGTNWDISDEKRAEEQMVQRNQALSAVNVEQLRHNDALVGEGAILEAANAAIAKIAATDVLTGLANRRHFYEVLEKAVSLARRQGSPLALVSIDLDGMKGVNDSAGHEAGDKVLESFAALLADMCRREDLPARLGGDEFSVVLPGIDSAGALGFAERVLAATRSCADLAARGVTVSGGVAALTDGEPPGGLLRRADEALYASKRSGGDAVSTAD